VRINKRNERDASLPNVIEEKHPVYDAFNQISQSRTRYQIDKFVIGQHDTDEQRYKQVVLEIQTLVGTIKRIRLTTEKTKIHLNELKTKKDPISQIDAELIQLDLDDTELGLHGALKELEYLLQVWENWEHKYTAEEIENMQPNYWNARLNRQASLEAIGSGGTVTWASLDALHQIGMLPSLDPNFYKQNHEIDQKENGELL
jgi:hypothetical protein